ncbi:hypothetical protein [Ochrobactrum teleogrylli]|uniref:Uncharacterized protein n=1 Tax=Ochrobactrum teleogrylli TaxID=2479765 RepID=A0ABD5K2X3_9HYPH
MKIKEITAILGPTDEALAAAINATGASSAELAQAWAWINADEALVNDGRSLPSGIIADLIDILEAANVSDEE